MTDEQVIESLLGVLAVVAVYIAGYATYMTWRNH